MHPTVGTQAVRAKRKAAAYHASYQRSLPSQYSLTWLLWTR